MSEVSTVQRVAALAESAGILRARDLALHGLPRHAIRRAETAGLIRQIARGLYLPADAPITERHTLAAAAKRVPGGVVCLLSALRFHDIGTQEPFEVWLAIGNKDRAPQPAYPPIRVVRFSGRAFGCGAEEHTIEGVPVRVTSIAKTVADCFKFRNKIGLDVAIEALRDVLRRRKVTPTALWEAAGISRVTVVMRPYVEALL